MNPESSTLHPLQAPAVFRALHDLVLVHLCDYNFDTAGPALARLWAEVEEEQLLTDEGHAVGSMPVEGLWLCDVSCTLRICTACACVEPGLDCASWPSVQSAPWCTCT